MIALLLVFAVIAIQLLAGYGLWLYNGKPETGIYRKAP